MRLFLFCAFMERRFSGQPGDILGRARLRSLFPSFTLLRALFSPFPIWMVDT